MNGTTVLASHTKRTHKEVPGILYIVHTAARCPNRPCTIYSDLRFVNVKFSVQVRAKMIEYTHVSCLVPPCRLRAGGCPGSLWAGSCGWGISNGKFCPGEKAMDRRVCSAPCLIPDSYCGTSHGCTHIRSATKLCGPAPRQGNMACRLVRA